MTSVLLVDDDAAFRTAISRDLARHGFEVVVAESPSDALARLRGGGFDVLLTDLRMSEGDGIELLQTCRKASRQTRAILMSAYATARDYKTAIELGAVHVLCKPFTPSELLEALNLAAECATGFHGTLHGLSLVDVLQMLHLGMRSVTVTVGGTVTSRVHVRKGDIVHAESGEATGVDALRAVLASESGSISTTAPEDVTRTITQSFDALLLDCLRVNDEEAPARRLDSDFFGFMAEPAPIVPALPALPAPSITPSVAPVTSQRRPTRSFAARARDAWQAVLAAIGGSSTAMALAVDLESGAVLELQGDCASIGEDVRALAAAVLSLTGPGNSVTYAIARDLGVGLVRAEAEGYAMAIFDSLPEGSAASWFRSHVATMGRTVTGGGHVALARST